MLSGMTDETVVSQQSVGKAWDRAAVLREAARLYEDAPESSVKLKCLEMILELLPPEAQKRPAGHLGDAARSAREAVRGKE